jgi:predicted Zn-dependent protease
MYRKSAGFLITTFLCFSLASCPGLIARADTKPAPAANAKPAEDPEVKLGRENAAENDKTVKLVTDPAILNRVRTIGNKLAAIANTVEVPALWGDSHLKVFPYTFKVVQDKDVNAYSMPGGFIYVNTGLLNFVHSDDELAGVLGHEITHCAHHHMLKLMHEQNKMQPAIAALILGLITTKTSSEDLGNWIMASQLYLTAKMNSYGVEAEKDADHGAVFYMMKAGYNPVGILTFMERLARQEMLQPDTNWGIYQTHPPSPERAAALLQELKDLHVPIDRRKVDPGLRADYVTSKLNDVPVMEVKMYNTPIAYLAADGSSTAESRAEAACQAINALFDEGLLVSDVRLTQDKNGIIARGQPIVTFSAADATAQKSTPQDLSKNALDALKKVIWEDRFNRMPGAG